MFLTQRTQLLPDVALAFARGAGTGVEEAGQFFAAGAVFDAVADDFDHAHAAVPGRWLTLQFIEDRFDAHPLQR